MVFATPWVKKQDTKLWEDPGEPVPEETFTHHSQHPWGRSRIRTDSEGC